MGGLAVVAPMGRYSNLSKLACCRSVMCRCCGQSLLCLRVPSSKTRVAKVYNSERSEQRRLIGSRSNRRGMRLWEVGKEGLKRSFKEESFRRLATDIVVCAYAHAFDAVQRKEVLPSEADGLRDSHDGRSGGAHPLREETRRFGYPDGQDGGAFSHWDGKRGGLTSSADQSSWQGPGGRETARNAGGGSCHPSDERFRHSGRSSDSWTMQGPSQDGDRVFQDGVLGGGSGVLEQRGGPGNGRPKNYISSQSSLNIPRSELLKIEELKFSGEMQEGDSSPQVLNLQRALFWLGHLPGLSLTGYFGPETTKALQEFHYSNGFSSPGVWGFHSQQLLWKHLYPETHQRHPDREIPETTQPELKNFPEYDLRDSWRFVKDASGKAIGDGLRASASLQRRHSKTFREFVASVSSSLPCPTVVSPRVGVLLLTVAVISIMVHFCFGRVHGQPVRKRVMSWRNGVDLRRPGKVNQSSFTVQKGHHKSSEGGKILQYFQKHLRPKSTEKQDRSMCNLLDRLVLFDGQVVRGDYPTNGKMLHSTRSELVHNNENIMVDASGSALRGSSLPVLSSKQVDQSGFNIEANKITHGLDQFQKPEADPARKVSSHSFSPVQSDKSIRLTGGHQLWSRSSPDPGWASWVGFLFASFFPNKERLPSSQRKPSSRRAVVRSTSSSRAKSPERGVPGDFGSHLRSSGVEKALSAEDEARRWQEEHELDLKKRVEELHRTVQSVEETREAAMRALAEEKMHNLELEVKFRRQKEAAAALEEEVRVLKDSHDALLASLKKKYSSSAAARAAAALLYQNWDPSDSSARV